MPFRYDDDGNRVRVQEPLSVRILKQLKENDAVWHPDFGECRVREIIEEEGKVTIQISDRSNWGECPKGWVRDIEPDELKIYGFEEREQLYRDGGWHKAPNALFLLKGPRQAQLLAFLMGHHWKFGLKQEWFWITTDTIVKHAYIKPCMVMVLLKSLEKQGFIERAKKKGDRKRYIRIRYDAIWEAVESLKDKWDQTQHTYNELDP